MRLHDDRDGEPIPGENDGDRVSLTLAASPLDRKAGVGVIELTNALGAGRLVLAEVKYQPRGNSW